MAQHKVLLIVGGGIAAYKSLDLVRRLGERGVGVRAILTRAGAEFITPLSLSALTGNKVYQDLFSLTDEAEMGHIQLSRSADLVVVAPATADLLARMAQGQADDLAATTLLATDKPVLVAPAMNIRMWQHAATQRNITRLQADGIHVVGPDDGAMACGEFGPGRMAEPLAIVDAVMQQLAPAGRPLAGVRALVTSGPTHEPIDPVRYIANRSSGKQGHAIAAAAAQAGARVTLVSGPVTIPDPFGVTVVRVETARQMLAAVEAALPADIAVFAAAVADWRVASEADEKIKKGASGTPELHLVENPDILASVGRHARLRPKVVIGFAAETENLIVNAEAKLKRKGADAIVANDVSPETGIMGGDRNQVRFVTAAGVDEWPETTKEGVAVEIVARAVRLLQG